MFARFSCGFYRVRVLVLRKLRGKQALLHRRSGFCWWNCLRLKSSPAQVFARFSYGFFCVRVLLEIPSKFSVANIKSLGTPSKRRWNCSSIVCVLLVRTFDALGFIFDPVFLFTGFHDPVTHAVCFPLHSVHTSQRDTLLPSFLPWLVYKEFCD